MKEDIKKIWVDALRSGDYGQGDGRLYDGESYCCLGVLCDLHQKMTSQGIWTHTTDEDNVDWVVYRDNTYGINAGETLPKAVVEWAGLIDANPNVGIYECASGLRHSRLAELNDHGFSFDELSDIIQEKL